MISFRVLTLLLGVSVLSSESLAQTSASGVTFQKSIKLDIPDSSGFAFASYVVPPGKRLILRYLAVNATLPSGQRFTSSVQATAQGEQTEFPQVYSAQSNGDGTDELVSNQMVTIVADAETTVYFQVFRRISKGGIRVVFAWAGELQPAL